MRALTLPQALGQVEVPLRRGIGREEALALIDRLLNEPSKANADRFCDAILNFTAWDMPSEGWPARFMKDTEWAWRYGRAALVDW